MEGPAPRVSVLIPFLDREWCLKDAIESVLAQSYTSWELLLIDDGSRDGSGRIAMGYQEEHGSRVRYLTHPDDGNHGLGASLQFGFLHSHGRYIALLDSDDAWLPDHLQTLTAVLDGAPDVAMAYGRARYWSSWSDDAQNQDYVPALGVPELIPLQPPELLVRILTGGAAVPPPCSVLVRRDAVSAIGGLDHHEYPYITYHDQVLYAKILSRYPAMAVDRCVSLYRRHDGSAWAQALATGQDRRHRLLYLQWLKDFIGDARPGDRELRRAVGWARMRTTWPRVAAVVTRFRAMRP
jgi:glycosyltransferase involved in cell wall biosynthesis